MKTDFGSPLILNVSLGMRSNFNLFKKKVVGDLNIGTFAYNYRYCDRADLAGGYGIKAGKHSLQDYGSRVDLNFNIAFIKNLTWRVESYFYTTYSVLRRRSSISSTSASTSISPPILSSIHASTTRVSAMTIMAIGCSATTFRSACL